MPSKIRGNLVKSRVCHIITRQEAEIAHWLSHTSRTKEPLLRRTSRAISVTNTMGYWFPRGALQLPLSSASLSPPPFSPTHICKPLTSLTMDAPPHELSSLLCYSQWPKFPIAYHKLNVHFWGCGEGRVGARVGDDAGVG